jgi:hypothetical protein
MIWVEDVYDHLLALQQLVRLEFAAGQTLSVGVSGVL